MTALVLVLPLQAAVTEIVCVPRVVVVGKLKVQADEVVRQFMLSNWVPSSCTVIVFGVVVSLNMANPVVSNDRPVPPTSGERIMTVEGVQAADADDDNNVIARNSRNAKE